MSNAWVKEPVGLVGRADKPTPWGWTAAEWGTPAAVEPDSHARRIQLFSGVLYHGQALRNRIRTGRTQRVNIAVVLVAEGPHQRHADGMRTCCTGAHLCICSPYAPTYFWITKGGPVSAANGNQKRARDRNSNAIADYEKQQVTLGLALTGSCTGTAKMVGRSIAAVSRINTSNQDEITQIRAQLGTVLKGRFCATVAALQDKIRKFVSDLEEIPSREQSAALFDLCKCVGIQTERMQLLAGEPTVVTLAADIERTAAEAKADRRPQIG
jgi:hypothetical protein